jgi:nucleotide-binding universal stress UspA family protein
MIKSLLVAMDASAYAQTALTQAIDLAKAADARLTALNVVDVRYAEMPPYLDYSYSFEGGMPYIPSLDLMEKFQEKGERILGDALKTIGQAGLAAETRVDEGVPGQVIADLATEHDLVVMGKRGEHAKWGRDLLGSTTEAVIKRSAIPVLLTEEQPRVLGKALVMFDDSEPANRALRLAVDLSAQMPLKIVVLNADDDTEQGQAILKVAKAVLSAHEVEAGYVVLPGGPEQAAAAALADDPADLVVMGTRGHSVIRDLFLGRTAEHVMRSVPVPVLLVP